MGARLRAGATQSDRAADGLAQLGRHAPADSAAVRHRAGGDRLCGAPRHCVSALRAEAGDAPRDLLFGQFLLQAPRSLDALACWWSMILSDHALTDAGSSIARKIGLKAPINS